MVDVPCLETGMRTILLLILVCLLGGLPLQALIYDEDLIGLGRGSGIFLRGDVNADQRVDLTDANFTLNYLFLRGEPPICRKAADTNDDGRLNVMDALALIDHLFRNAGALPTPAEACGLDPTLDGLDCEAQSTCP